MKKIKDIGIAYTSFYGKYPNKFISFCTPFINGDLLVVEQANTLLRVKEDNHGHSQIKEKVIDGIGRIVSCQQNESNDIFILTSSPNRIIRVDSSNKITVVNKIREDLTPLSFSLSRWGMAITCLPATLIFLGKIDYELNLVNKGFIEPMWVEQTASDSFLITDSLSHTVKKIKLNGNTLWSYGQYKNPGNTDGKLFMPMCAITLPNGNILVSEERNHRILEISHNKEVKREYGKNGWVGSDDHLLWAPSTIQLDSKKENLIVTESKAGRVVKINRETGKKQNLYGKPLLLKSELNFPRSCEWSNSENELLVADTGHSRIVSFNSEGEKCLEVTKTSLGFLNWPRCAKWVKSNILVTDSRNRRVLLINRNGDVKKSWDKKSMIDILPKDEWLQVAELSTDGKQLLIASESEFAVYDANKNNLLWSSLGKNITFNDIHYAEFLQDGSVIVTDTSNDRAILVRPMDLEIFISEIYKDEKKTILRVPRQVRSFDDGFLVVDSGNSKVYKLNQEKNWLVTKAFGKGRGLGTEELSGPRWACPGPMNTVFISDTDNHRIVWIDWR